MIYVHQIMLKGGTVMKKMLLGFLCILLMSTVLPGMAAQLLEESTSGIPGALEILSISYSGGDATRELTDGNMFTGLSLRNQISSQLVLTVELLGDDVSAVWIRNGDYNSRQAYERCYAPREVAVTVAYDYGNREAKHVYRLSDAYNTDQTWGDWYQGFQRLALPQTYQDVDHITLTVRSYYSFANTTASSPLVISDIAVVGISGENFWSGSDGGYDVDTDSNTTREPATLTMRMATRTGPCTNYTEPGTFLQEGAMVEVITKVYDEYNEIWWVQTEFSAYGDLMRAYTGMKRVQGDFRYVPEEEFLGTVRVPQSVSAWYGPGYEYKQFTKNVPAGTYCSVYNRENGWVQVEYYDSSRSLYRRVWVPESMTYSD